MTEANCCGNSLILTQATGYIVAVVFGLCAMVPTILHLVDFKWVTAKKQQLTFYIIMCVTANHIVNWLVTCNTTNLDHAINFIPLLNIWLVFCSEDTACCLLMAPGILLMGSSWQCGHPKHIATIIYFGRPLVSLWHWHNYSTSWKDGIQKSE